MKISVFHTPELVPDEVTADCAIAIDVLRATTTMAAALANGADSIQFFSDLDELQRVSESWDAGKRLRAGERGGQKVEHFDLGNSPLECTPDLVRDRRLFISTTNGTRALKKIQTAPIVLTAALTNRETVVRYLLEKQPETVWIVGAGWEGTFALEDTVCAGAIAQRLADQMGCKIGELSGNDELIDAVTLYRHWQTELLELFHHASHGKRLVRLDGHADLKYCSELDTVDILPIQGETGVLVRG
ncbi:2-phosphosulfolactate phosphatase family protein [filamentous cyanobacterium LEGE 11480]|uniref:Probable 2-phosphosulfolactate phosphatase n=1 Tax=Romeriopsis navalis LEGE 11480 TaxID=2777977 RepID=A0A928Z0E4_9CYAN|nr:2-phosphosulfolactate phosphatase family protein [Romeriopsis navalis]MBE9028186.1 2-phosphosulfolactate phosphatase family protein [Romeriopsis navalis LEGE 11480]